MRVRVPYVYMQVVLHVQKVANYASSSEFHSV